MTTDNTTGFEAKYKAEVLRSDLSVVSRGSANAVVETLLANRNDPQSTDLLKQIQEAAAAGDTDKIEQLADQLKTVKAVEAQRNSRLVELAREYSLKDVLRAFPAFKDLVYELGLLVLEKTEEGIAQQKKPRATGERPFRDTGPLYVISHEGKHIEARKNVGAAKSPGAEKEFYDFMGLDVSADGKLVTPASFVNIKGETVSTQSKKNIINDLLAGHKLWLDKGFRIKEKQVQSE
jgi:hypothetical protein